MNTGEEAKKPQLHPNADERLNKIEYTFFESLLKVPSDTQKRASDKKSAVPEKKSVTPPEGKSESKDRTEVKVLPDKSSQGTGLRKIFTIQVASFKKREAAFALKERLERKEYDAYIMIFSKNDTKWFRVRVGKLESRGEAGVVLEKIKNREKLGAYIARYTR